MSELDRVAEAMSRVLMPGQRATLEREGAEVFLNIDNTRTLCGVRVSACPGCDACLEANARHLRFTPYTLAAKQ